MTENLSRQTAEFFAAGGLGIALGLVYDLGRAIRREKPGLTIPVDLLFGLVFFLSLWLTSIYTWGLRLYQVLGSFLGASVYFLTVSPPLVRIFRTLLRGMRRFIRFVLAPTKKSLHFLKKVLKKLFPSARKWGTIFTIPFSRKERQEAKR